MPQDLTYPGDLDLLHRLFQQDQKAFYFGGCDEVGRGPLAGPVVGASVGCVVETHKGHEALCEFFERLKSLGVTDSKKLTPFKRQKILHELRIDFKTLPVGQVTTLYEAPGLWVGQSLFECSPQTIDSINILQSALRCMGHSTLALWESFSQRAKVMPTRGLVLVDGNQIPKLPSPLPLEFRSLIKGDSRSILIGLASITAKEFRDHYMEKMDELWPQYGFRSHYGYPTPSHKEAISQHGPSPIHRRSFAGVKEHC